MSNQVKVSFALTNETVVSPTPNIELEQKWYTQEEYDYFQQAAEFETQRLKMLLASNIRLAENDFCEFIGIEKFLSPELLTELNKRKRAHFDAILVSQRFWNSEALARISEDGSHWARLKAQEFAEMYTELSSTLPNAGDLSSTL